MPSFYSNREKWPSWKLSFQAIIHLDDCLTSAILEPWNRGKDFMPDDVGTEQRAQERLRSMLVLSCNAHESDVSFLVNLDQWDASMMMMMIEDVLEPRHNNENVAMFAGWMERLARQLHSGCEIPLICAELLGIFLLPRVGKDCAPPRGTAAARPHPPACKPLAHMAKEAGSAGCPEPTAPHGGSALWDVQALRPMSLRQWHRFPLRKLLTTPSRVMGLRGAAVVKQSHVCKHLADTPAVCCIKCISQGLRGGVVVLVHAVHVLVIGKMPGRVLKRRPAASGRCRGML